MLEHEPQETPAAQKETPAAQKETPAAQIPASQRRVSAEELTRAVSALEDAKAAERMAGVAPIGQVVEELGLESTPEEIWAQVEKQRAEKSALKPHVNAVPVTQNKKLARRVIRGWHGMSWWIWVIFWCSGGLGLFAGLPHLLHSGTAGGQTITINGDFGKQTVMAQGKDVIISGDKETITLQGTAHSVEVNGDFDAVTGDAPQNYVINGDGSSVKFNVPTKPPTP